MVLHPNVHVRSDGVRPNRVCKQKNWILNPICLPPLLYIVVVVVFFYMTTREVYSSYSNWYAYVYVQRVIWRPRAWCSRSFKNETAGIEKGMIWGLFMEGTHGIPAVDVIILCVHISTKSLAAYLRLTLRQRAILPPSVKNVFRFKSKTS